MFNSFLDPNNKLLINRLARAQAQILGLSLSTKEEYLAQVTSIVNKVINIGYSMQPLTTIAANTPGVVGDPVSNLLTLNEDAGDIAEEIDRLEDNASVLFNLSAASRNSIGQQIREAIYASTGRNYVEEFINKNQIDPSSTAEIDLSAGSAQLPLSKETILTPLLTVGKNSVGSSTGDITTILNGATETLFTWAGSSLEIIVTFNSPTVVNRIKIAPETYIGYAITTLTASADGSSFDDVLASLNVEEIVLDATSGKYSGATIVDFSPRSVSKLRIVIQNLVSFDAIGLRNISFSQRSFEATGNVVSTPQTSPSGPVSFVIDQEVDSPYVSITHQISSDSVHYTTIQPGAVTLPSQWWYRALLSRSAKAFSNSSSAVAATTADPTVSSGFTLVSSSSAPLSDTTVERTLVFNNVSGTIPLAETPISGTLQVSQGSLYLTNGVSLDNQNVLTLPFTGGTFTVTYQASSQGAQDLASLQNYYSPLLSSVRFTQQ